MTKIELVSAIHYRHAAYSKHCKAVIWLAEFAPEALDKLPDDPGTLLSRANVRMVRPEDLTSTVGAVMAEHESNIGAAKRILYESQFIYRLALFEGFLADVMDVVLVHKPDLFQSQIGRRDIERSITSRIQWLAAGFRMQLGALPELIARRNVRVHADGVVDSRYLKVSSSGSLKEGERLELTWEYLRDADIALGHFADQLCALIEDLPELGKG